MKRYRRIHRSDPLPNHARPFFGDTLAAGKDPLFRNTIRGLIPVGRGMPGQRKSVRGCANRLPTMKFPVSLARCAEVDQGRYSREGYPIVILG